MDGAGREGKCHFYAQMDVVGGVSYVYSPPTKDQFNFVLASATKLPEMAAHATVMHRVRQISLQNRNNIPNYPNGRKRMKRPDILGIGDRSNADYAG